MQEFLNTYDHTKLNHMIFKEEQIQTLLQLFHETQREETHSMKPVLYLSQNRQGYNNKRELKGISLMNLDAKNFNKILAN
jgi:hypothetical protein